MTEDSVSRPPPEGPESGARHHRPTLPVALRIALFIVGWSLLLIGVAGLVLPGIQGILTILLGAAVLSVASETVYRLLRKTLRPRWPRLWGRVKGIRRKVHDRFSRQPDSPKEPPRESDSPGPSGGADSL